MNDKVNNIIYTAQDIEQYITGKLTPLQMHAMEKAALDDEFLAEAIEGYQGVKTEEWKKQIDLLKDKFENKETTAKVIPLIKRNNNWWKAAAVLLIGGTATLSYLFFNKTDKQQIAQNAKTISTSDSIVRTTNEPEKTFVITTPQEDLKIVEKNKTNKIENNLAAVTETIKPDSNFIYKPVAPPAAVPAKKYAANDLEDVAKSNAAPVTNNAAPEAEYNNALNEVTVLKKTVNNKNEKVIADRKEVAQDKNSQPLSQVFAAQVVATDNSPLPFANISIKSENFGTYADVKGNFRLVSSDSLLTVEIKAAGYQTQFYTLQSYSAQNKIVLAEEDFASKQKTIVGLGKQAKGMVSRRATLLKDSLINAEPADGWDNYTTYVDNNIDIPDEILKKNLHGQVELSFDVKPNGSITNIKIDKSLCNNCDEAAKRLILQGPQWKTKNGRKGKGKVTVQF